MADSGYFDGSEFKATDENATQDGAPFSSVLEGKIANNNEWLHRYGGGCVVHAYESKAATTTGTNNNFKHSAVWSAMTVKPFFVTKGLKKVKVVFQGEIKNYDIDVKLQIGNSFSPITQWLLGTNHQVRSVEIELPVAADFDYDTTLILWARSSNDNVVPADYYTVEAVNGKLGGIPVAYISLTPSLTPITLNTDKAIVLYGVSDFIEDSSLAGPFICDPINRRLSIDLDLVALVNVTPAITGTPLIAGEMNIAYVTVRSLQIRQEFV